VESSNKKKKPIRVVLSVLAAFIGVQKKQALEEDFSQQSPVPFIIAGLVLAALFIASLATVVSVVLSN